MITLLKRIIKIGYNNFFRNMSLNIATVFVIIIVVSLISVLYVFNTGSNMLISSIQEKVDISIYFSEDIPTEDILSVKSTLSDIPEVKKIDYISKEESLDNFIERHKDDPLVIESLTEIGTNPFLASLSIHAKDGLDYEKITEFLKADSYSNMIEKVDYYQRKPVIEKVFAITSGVTKGGISLSIILGVIAVLIAFNTVRIAICNSQEEISVMRLVGASNLFIRGPFLVQGIIWGLLSAIISFILIFVITYGINSPLSSITSINIFSLFMANIWALLLIQIGSGIAIGVLSSLAAVEKYLD